MKTVPFVVFLCFLYLSTASANRRKRFLIVPPAVPQRHQWIAGIGIPLDLENIAVTTGYVIRAQYFLPTKVSELFPVNTWEGLERQRRDVLQNEVELVDNSTGRKFSTYDVPAVLIEESSNRNAIEEAIEGEEEEEEDEEFASWDSDKEIKEESETAQTFWNALYDPNGSSENSRWIAYKALEGIANNNGMGGKDCVLRTICESASTPISHKSGIFGELLHILLTPSSSRDIATSNEHQEYVEAEKFGERGLGSCEEKYPECTKSLIDVVTTFDNPFTDLFGKFF